MPVSFSIIKIPSLATLTLTLLTLSACDRGTPPATTLEAAVQGIHGAALSDNGRFAAIGSINHGGSLWRIKDGERLYNWNHKANAFTTILNADFSPEGNWAITADPHTMVLWSMKDGSSFRFWTAPGEILSISLAPEGELALLGLDDHTATIFDVKRGGIKRTFHHANRVRSVAFSNDARRAISGSEDYTASVWNVASGKAINSFKHNDEVHLVALSPNGKQAFSVAKYDRAVLWDVDTGKAIGSTKLNAEKLRRGMTYTAAKFSNDGRQLLTGRPDQIIELWDTRNLERLHRWELPKRDAWQPTSSAAAAVGFGSNGEYFAVGSNGYVHRLER